MGQNKNVDNSAVIGKLRRHHNNKGYRQIRRGKTANQTAYLARLLNIPLKIGDQLFDARREARRKRA